MTRRPVATVAALVLLLAWIAAACTDPPRISLPDPPSVPGTTTTLPPTDYGKVGVTPIVSTPGTTTTVPIGPGPLTLAGRVTGPDGPVAAATVRLQRFVGDRIGTIDLFTDDTGAFRLEGITGGRWRVRAWRTPDLAVEKPLVLYLVNETQPTPVDLLLRSRSGTVVSASVAPVPLPVGDPANLAVLVATESVDAQGVVRSAPQPFVTVELIGSGSWRLQSENPAIADEFGVARWGARCFDDGPQPLSALIDGTSYRLELPDCGLPPTTTTSSRVTATTKR